MQELLKFMATLSGMWVWIYLKRWLKVTSVGKPLTWHFTTSKRHHKNHKRMLCLTKWACWILLDQCLQYYKKSKNQHLTEKKQPLFEVIFFVRGEKNVVRHQFIKDFSGCSQCIVLGEWCLHQDWTEYSITNSAAQFTYPDEWMDKNCCQ